MAISIRKVHDTMVASQTHPFDLADWFAEGLRLTAFVSPSVSIKDQSWWETLLESPPEVKTQRPKEGVQREEGPFEQGRLSLETQPARVDWRYSGSSEPLLESQQPLPGLGSFPSALVPFLSLMHKWVSIGPSLNRLAFGAVLFLPTQSRVESYQKLSLLLPFALDAEGSTDFSYQINRSRQSVSSIANLKINRLSKWLAQVMRFGLIMPQNPAPKIQMDDHHACRLELDINTHQDYEGEFNSDAASAVMDELVSLAQEIASNGDKP